MKMDPMSVQELVCAVLGLDPNEDENEDWGLLEDLLFKRYEIDMEQFEKIAGDLLKLTPIVETAITGTKYHAFVRGDEIIARAACA